MGNVLGIKSESIGAKIENKDIDDRDDRRRNSLAFYINQFVKYEGDDYATLVEQVKQDKYAKFGGKAPTVRPSSMYILMCFSFCYDYLFMLVSLFSFFSFSLLLLLCCLKNSTKSQIRLFREI